MQHPFFKETAEEMVNRLFDEWLTKNIFVNNTPLKLPIVRQDTINDLKKVDERFRKMFKPEDDMLMIQSVREHCVLLNLTKAFSYLFNKVAPPKPTHRQTQHKQSHLRLVVNG